MFCHTHIYAVYVKPGAAPDKERPVLIKEGFNLYAFLFGIFWALYHRLWWPLVMIFAFNLAMMYGGRLGLLSQESLAAIQMGFQLLVGLHANDWRQTKLRRKGFRLADIAAADSELKAEQRYFERMLAAA